MLLHNGYIYRLHQALADGATKTYRCPIKLCAGRIHMKDDEITVVTGHVCEMSNPENNALRKLQHEIKRRASDTEEALYQIILLAESHLTAAEAAEVPSYVSLQRTIKKKRKREQQPHLQPANIAEFELLAALETTIGDE